MRTAIFLERDGILTEPRTDRQYQVAPVSLEDFKVNEHALPALQSLKSAGFLLIVTTNQPGISNGNLPRRELDRMHDLLRQRFPLDDILVFPHDESDHCPSHHRMRTDGRKRPLGTPCGRPVPGQ